jgi:hypothetical protein
MHLKTSTDEELAAHLARLAEEAIFLHAKMTGEADAEETFIRDIIAMGLFNELGTTVGMEVTPPEFRDWVAEASARSAYDGLRGEVGNHQIDLIVWHSDWDAGHRSPRAIVEIKKGQDFLQDVRRTSRLLSVCHSSAVGFQLVAQVASASSVEGSRRRVDELIARAGGLCGNAITRPPTPIPDDPNRGWCCIFVVPVACASMQAW